MLALLLAACLVDRATYERRLAALTDDDGDGWNEDEGDCDDGEAGVYPGAVETCDGIDQDCDREVDEGADLGGDPRFRDLDGDGYGDPDAQVTGCDRAEPTVSDASDCDDGDASVHPDAPETCDGEDDDCDGETDDDPADGTTWWVDADGDGWGHAETVACEGGEGLVTASGDCDDGDAGVYPGAGESIDGVDQDCSGVADDLDAPRDAVVVEGAQAGEWAGAALLFADVDLDGEDELIVGAPGADTGAAPCAVYLLEGDLFGYGDLGEARVVESGTGVRCGAALAYDDVARLLFVGAPRDGGGRVDVLSVPDLTLTATWDYERIALLGQEISKRADVDGDGVSEIILGVEAFSLGTSRMGLIVAVESTAPSGVATEVADFGIEGPGAMAEFGSSVAAGIDLNGDGYDDFAGGAVSWSDGGQAWLFLGGTPPPDEVTDAIATFVGATDAEAGALVALDGGWEDDDTLRWWVGEPGAASGGGAALAFEPDAEGTLTESDAEVFVQGEPGNGLGSSIVGSEKWAGTIVSAPGYRGATGAAWFFTELSGSVEPGMADVSVDGGDSLSSFGQAAATTMREDVWAFGARDAGNDEAGALVLVRLP